MPTASPSDLTSVTHRRQRQLRRWCQRSLAIVAGGVGLVAGSLAIAPSVSMADEPMNNVTNGVYVFGESPEAGQLGTTYMVMEVAAGEIKGGFYQPSSSFDCFHGTVTQNELALTVIDSYAQTSYPFAVALESQSAVAASEAIAGEWVPTGFHPISELSATDEHVLQVCQGQA